MTKTAPRGQEILWTDSNCPCSAVLAFQNHLTINSNVPNNAPLFAFETESGSHASMMRKWFLERCNEIWALEKLDCMSGHSFHIGGTTHLLLGVDPFVVMMQGRWCSNAFLEYWWHCEEVLPTGHSYRSLSNLLLVNPLEHGRLQEKTSVRMTALALQFHMLVVDEIRLSNIWSAPTSHSQERHSSSGHISTRPNTKHAHG